MKFSILRILRFRSPLAAWTGCIRSNKSGEIRFSLFD